MDHNNAYLLLGSNLGDRIATINNALEKIEENAGLIIQRSSYYETEPWGFTHENSFINIVVEINTSFEPKELLSLLLEIEHKMGRTREEDKMGARNIDIDILLYNDSIISEPNIVIPHPRIQLRKFTLIPLAEIAPKKEHPIMQKSIETLLRECPDKLEVKKIDRKI